MFWMFIQNMVFMYFIGFDQHLDRLSRLAFMAMILSDLELLDAHFCQLAQMPFGLKEILTTLL